MALEQYKPIELQDVKDKLDEKVNTSDVPTLAEIKNSTDFSGKVASASALKATHNKIRQSNMSDTPLGEDRMILQSPYAFNDVFYLRFITLVFRQYRDLEGIFEQIAVLANGDVIGVNLKTQLSTSYNSAVAFAIVYERI